MVYILAKKNEKYSESLRRQVSGRRPALDPGQCTEKGVYSLTRRSEVRFGGNPENICSWRAFPLMTQSRRRMFQAIRSSMAKMPVTPAD